MQRMQFHTLEGVVTHISPIGVFSNRGETVFVSLKTDQNLYIYLAISGEYLQWKYSLINYSRCQFKGYYMTAKSEGIHTWYMTEKECSYSHIPHHRIESPSMTFFDVTTCSSPSASSDVDCYPNIIQPFSLVEKEMFENNEINITGNVDTVHHSSMWIEFKSCSSISTDIVDNCTLGLYFQQRFSTYLDASQLDKLTSGCTIHAYAVLPIYMWGKLAGFAATVRSHVSISADCNNTTTSNRSKRRRQDLSCFDGGSQCFMYRTWITYMRGKLKEAILPSLSSRDMKALYELIDLNPVADITNSISTTSITPHLLTLCTQSTARNTVKEFVEVGRIQLYNIRAGIDSDYLSSLMPRVWSALGISQVFQAYINHEHTTNSSSSGSLTAVGNALVFSIKECPFSPDFSCVSSNWTNMTGLKSDDLIVGTVGDTIVNNQTVSIVNLFDITDSTNVRCILINNSGSLLFDDAAATDNSQYHVVIRNPTFIYSDAAINATALIAYPETYRIFKSEANGSYAAGETQHSQDSVPISASPSAGKLSWQYRNTHCASVRHILLSDITAAGCKMEVIGVIIYIEYASSSTGLRQCSLRLRDCKQADIITIYLPINALKYHRFTVGMIVSCKNCQISLSRNKKYVHTTHRDNAIENISIESFVDSIDALKAIVNACKYRPPAVSLIYSNESKSSIYPRNPPRQLVGNLYGSYASNRCVWTLVGQVCFFNQITVTLKCCNIQCRNKNANAPLISASYRCENCGSSSKLQPYWTGRVLFDDGTGTCRLLLEGDDVLAAIPVTSDNYREFIDTKKQYEDQVRVHGKVECNPLYDATTAVKFGYNVDEEEATTDIGSNARATAAASSSCSSIKNRRTSSCNVAVIECKTRLADFLKYSCAHANTIEVVVKICADVTHTVQQQTAKLQDINNDRRYQCTMSETSVSMLQPMLVDTYAVRALTSIDITRECRKQLLLLDKAAVEEIDSDSIF